MSSSSEEEFVGDEESSDDMPLSNLKRNGRKRTATTYEEESPSDGEEESEAEIEEDNDDEDERWDEDDEEEYAPKGKRKFRSTEESDESDDDDDIPLSALKASPAKKGKNGSKKSPAKAKSKKATTTKKSKQATKKKEVTAPKSNDGYQSASAALYGSECQKGLLIQRLLCRWWYSITWPDPAALPEKPPAHFDSLDGFPGVYICTEGDDVGQILDVRDKNQCPNFRNFAKKSSAELQTLLLKALEEQKKKLIQIDGPGTSTEKELNDLIKWTKKLKPATADREAAKVLKAAKLTLA